MEKIDSKNVVMVGAKVSPESRARLDNAAEKLGMTEYEAIQTMIHLFIQMTSDKCNLSEEMETLIGIFDGCKNWVDGIKLGDPMECMNVSAAFYLLAEEGKHGTIPVYVEGDTTDMFRKEVFNKRDVVEQFFKLVLPSMYERLMDIGKYLGTSNAYMTLLRLLDDFKANPDAEAIQEMFASDDWAENGKRMSNPRTKSTRTIIQGELF